MSRFCVFANILSVTQPCGKIGKEAAFLLSTS